MVVTAADFAGSLANPVIARRADGSLDLSDHVASEIEPVLAAAMTKAIASSWPGSSMISTTSCWPKLKK